MNRRIRAHGDRGATIVEFAIISSLLFMLLFGLVDLGIIEIGNSVGSNAARNGARVGIVKFLCADDDPVVYSGCTAGPTDNYNSIVNAVQSQIVGLVSGLSVSVRCIDGTTNDPTYPASATKHCDSSIVPGIDLLEVIVSWNAKTTSAFVQSAHHSEIARMVIVGTPNAAAAPPPGCVVTSVTFSPNPDGLSGATSGALSSALTVTAMTNNDPACSGIQAQFTSASPVFNQTLVIVGSGPTYSATVSTLSTYNEANNPQNVNILSADGSLDLYPGAQFNVGGCLVNSITFAPVGGSPSQPIPVDGQFQPTTPVTVTVATNGDTACSTLKAVYTTATSYGTHGPPLTGSGPNYTDLIGTGSTSPTFPNGNPQSVSIESSGGVVLLSQSFYVQSTAPTITSCSPGIHKSTTATMTIAGTNFVSGSTVSFSGGFTINGSPTETGGNQITLSVTAANAQNTSWDVTVTNPGPQSGTKANCASIIP